MAATPPSDNRLPLSVRLAPSGMRWLSDLMVETKANKTTVVRACFAIARRYEPELRHLIKEMNQ